MNTEKKHIKYDNLKKAMRALEKSIFKCESLKDNAELREYIRDSAIQRFKISFDLATNLFPICAEAGLIQNSELWIEFKRNRNLTSHAYNNILAEKIYNNSKIFLTEVNLLVNN